MGTSARREYLGSWSGTRAELQKLINEVQAILRPVSDPKLQELKQYDADQVALQKGWLERDEAWLAEHDGDDAATLDGREYHRKSVVESYERLRRFETSGSVMRDMFEQAWSLKLQIEDKNGTDTEIRYDASTIADVINPRTVKTISISAPDGYIDSAGAYNIQISGDNVSGLKLSVEGPNVAFTNSAMGRLRAELRKSRPWWFWMTNSVLVLILGGVVFTTALFLVLSPLGESLSATSLIASVIGGYGLASVMTFALRKSFPAILILDDSGKNRAGGVVLWLVTLAASVPLGLLVNYLSAQ